MRKIILLLSFFILAIISLTFVQAAGTDTAISRFNMPGCEDQTLPYFCSISDNYGIPFYCTSSLGKPITNCTKCGCPPPNNLPAIWCNTAISEPNCEERPTECTPCSKKTTLTGCQGCLGVCYWNETAATNKCKGCPDKTAEQIDCSFYGTDNNACAQDMCFLGKTGFGVGFYESPWVIVNYSCELDNTVSPQSCRLGYNTIDPKTGRISRCRTMQQLGACVNDAAILTWSKKCTSILPPYAVTEESPEQQTSIPCGRVASPLPFFSILNMVVVAIFFSIYYFSIRNKKIR